MTNVCVPHSPSVPTTVDAAISKLRDWYDRVGTTIAMLDAGNDRFETVEPGPEELFPYPLIRPREVRSTGELRGRTDALLTYVWHFGDYIQHVLREARGLTEKQAKDVVAHHIQNSESLQTIAYLVNSAKHADATKSWGRHRAPRLTEPVILAPDGFGTYSGVEGDAWTDMRASFAGPVIQSIAIETKDGRKLQDARWHAEYGAASWVALLTRLGIDDWAEGEARRMVAAVAHGVRESQTRTGIHQSSISVKIASVANAPKLLIKMQRTPPVLLMFPRFTQSFVGPIDLRHYGSMMA